MSLTTADNVKLFLSKSTLSVMETAQVNLLIGLVDGVISNYCGWEMVATDYTGKAFNGNGSSELDLKVYPINTLTKVLIDEEDVTADLTMIKDEGILYFADGGSFTAGRANVLIDFNAGFAVGQVPGDLQYAANYLVAINFGRIDMQNIGVSEERFENATAKYDFTDLPVLVKRVLDRYRLISIW